MLRLIGVRTCFVSGKVTSPKSMLVGNTSTDNTLREPCAAEFGFGCSCCGFASLCPFLGGVDSSADAARTLGMEDRPTELCGLLRTRARISFQFTELPAVI